MIVVDTNVVAYLHLPGEHTNSAENVFMKDSSWLAPYLWRSEFRNILALYLRQNQITLAQAQEVMAKAERLLEGKTYQVTSVEVLALVQISRCSAYDCEFVALAQRLNVPLVTADKHILSEFPGIALLPDQFVNS